MFSKFPKLLYCSASLLALVMCGEVRCPSTAGATAGTTVGGGGSPAVVVAHDSSSHDKIDAQIDAIIKTIEELDLKLWHTWTTSDNTMMGYFDSKAAKFFELYCITCYCDNKSEKINIENMLKLIDMHSSFKKIFSESFTEASQSVRNMEIGTLEQPSKDRLKNKIIDWINKYYEEYYKKQTIDKKVESLLWALPRVTLMANYIVSHKKNTKDFLTNFGKLLFRFTSRRYTEDELMRHLKDSNGYKYYIHTVLAILIKFAEATLQSQHTPPQDPQMILINKMNEVMTELENKNDLVKKMFRSVRSIIDIKYLINDLVEIKGSGTPDELIKSLIGTGDVLFQLFILDNINEALGTGTSSSICEIPFPFCTPY